VLKTVVFPDPANPTSPILIDDRTAAAGRGCQYSCAIAELRAS
jgi:hypothetical protein